MESIRYSLSNMNGLLIITFALVLAVQGRGLANQDEFHSEFNNYYGGERIVGGTVAVNHSQPWMIYIDSPDSFCGGALIDSQWVLTAAHCLLNATTDYTVVAGTNQVCVNRGGQPIEDFGDGVKRRITKIFMKDFTTKKYHNDIALAKLDTPLTLNNNIKTISLTTKEYAAGSKLQMSGWGDAYSGSQVTECLLRTVELPVVSTTDCRKKFKKLVPTQMCAGYIGVAKGICTGDSGGPLVDLKASPAVLVGVATIATHACDNYGIFTSARHYHKWIKDTMKN